ncbi:HIG1 domain family member 2A, mitochondrial [Nothoprocta perdicaria]|uniref:HIG1 domain family member 2A, mitochondrial n=1 Tax=Nothoprocta perdicaria TaxID=30464 RepID=UPI000E1C1087|nr:HIG1 domain family member 2A, mitochondrial [Nothoprocta perdicaria]
METGPPELPPELPPVFRDESFSEKFLRKTRENPLVPLGCLCTAAVLAWGLVSFKKGDVQRSQLLMRARVVAQGFTVAALLGGMAAAAAKARQ